MRQSGDILMVHNNTWLGKAIRCITRSSFNHCGIFVSEDELVEATYKGVEQNNISKFDSLVTSNKCSYSVYRVKNITSEQIQTVVNFVKQEVGDKYEITQIIELFFVFVFHLPRNLNLIDDKKQWICSELVAEAFQDAGIKFFDKIRVDDMVPGDIPKSDIVEQVII